MKPAVEPPGKASTAGLYPIEPYPPVIVNAAITGVVPLKSETPHVPVTEDEIIRDALACHKAGAAVIHLHVREEEGRPCYKGGEVRQDHTEDTGRVRRRPRRLNERARLSGVPKEVGGALA